VKYLHAAAGFLVKDAWTKAIKARKAFYPLPSQRAKLVESFLELVYNEKSMLVDTVQKLFRLVAVA
jgi:hypothetical protein